MLGRSKPETYCAFDDAPLLTPGRLHSSAFVSDKHVILKKPAGVDKIGITVRDAPEVNHTGVIVYQLAEGSASAASELLVGDIVYSIDGVPTTSATEAARLISDAKPGSSLFVLAMGGTREVVLDKRHGDCGMTCAAAKHVNRGVLLKRIQPGSLADKAKLYPGDTIVSVNGTLVNHHAEAVAAIDKVRDVVRLVVLGESTELTIAPKSASNLAPLGVTCAKHESAQDGAGVKVVAVTADGRGAQAGLTAGDTLLSVNGVLCTDHHQAVAMLDTISQGEDLERKPIKVVVQSKYSHCY